MRADQKWSASDQRFLAEPVVLRRVGGTASHALLMTFRAPYLKAVLLLWYHRFRQSKKRP